MQLKYPLQSSLIIKTNTTYLIDQDSDQSRIDTILTDIELIKPIPEKNILGELSEENEDKFISGVKACLDYIVAGDVFQVNLSRQWQYKLTKEIDSAVIYHALKKC